MAFKLNDIEILYPVAFARKYIEVAQSNDTIEGTTKRRVVTRVEQFSLSYTDLTPGEAAFFLHLFDQNLVVDFEVDETNLDIGPTRVVMDIVNRKYNKTGKTYREDMVVVLTEVS